ncbi:MULTISPECIES: organic hydroperoxide resistance protein [Nocardiopsidaceae]|jgi:lipoyl-dependent peroxiredoxin|uniref:Organic hydroperoxide resistance protein n=2 Tax=Nocardiopsidaceae TaxID=83676 RepID=A0ABY6YEP1_9ACTN|nr:organic hydroperoxide resistance protein [Streptomonospora nanhaiensis]WAE70704.1 organic hydroperoxide resistance protein [Streptomonospora nanhaiensis]
MAYKAMYTTNATVTGEGRKGSGKTDDGRLAVDLSVPKGVGGDDGLGTNPEQLFAVGYGACFHGALKNVARQSKTDVEGSFIEARVTLGKSDEGLDIAVQLTVTIPGVEQAKAEELVEAAHQMCPYSRATRGNIEVDLVVKTA